MMAIQRKSANQRLHETTHDMAQGLYDAGIIDATTWREYKTLCVPPVKALTPFQIKRIRLKLKLSQTVFAKCLNTSVSTVRQWEQGVKHPRGIALKLLNLVDDKGLEILT